MKILLVEPNRTFQQIILNSLASLTQDVDVVATAEQARVSYADAKYSLLVIARQLPDQNGEELVQQFRQQSGTSRIPVVLLTSEKNTQITNQALASGVTEVFQRDELEKLLDYLIKLCKEHSANSDMEGHILLVEDTMTMAQIMMAYLGKMGLSYEHCTTGEEAVELYNKHDFDLVMTDFMLEGQMTGLHVLREIRAHENSKKARVPVLSVTGVEEESRVLELLRAGANDIVNKPVVFEQLQVRVRNLLQNKKLIDQVEEQALYMNQLAMTDQLTGLYNRHYLMEYGPKAVSECIRHQQQLTLMVVDVDHFKKVNDTYGHSVGDKVLIAVGVILNDVSRDEDVATRFGGEEFVILLRHCSQADAVKKAEKLRQDLEQLKPEGITVTASFGIASVDNDKQHDFDALFTAADTAVYRAKENGRNQVQIGSC